MQLYQWRHVTQKMCNGLLLRIGTKNQSENTTKYSLKKYTVYYRKLSSLPYNYWIKLYTALKCLWFSLNLPKQQIFVPNTIATMFWWMSEKLQWLRFILMGWYHRAVLQGLKNYGCVHDTQNISDNTRYKFRYTKEWKLWPHLLIWLNYLFLMLY